MPRSQRFTPRQTDREATSEPEALRSAGGVSGGARLTLRPPPWDKSPEAESGSFGAWLRRQREAREISLREVAERTKISLRYLEAMEDDKFDLLPAPVFAKGFLREYARYVGLSPDEVVNHYLAVQQPKEPGAEASLPERRSTGRLTYGPVLLAACLVLIGLLALILYWRERHQPAASASARPTIIAPPAIPPPPVAPPSAAAPATAPLVVSLQFNSDCWVETVVDGVSGPQGNHSEGDAMQLEAQKSVVLTLGNAGGVEARVNGYPLPALGKPGEVVHDLRLDLDTVRTLKEKQERH